MMWNWMASSLFAGAAIVCFDGFAAYPKLSAPWDLVERERVTHLGTSPRFLQAGRKRVKPIEDNDLSALRVIFSTGSPLMPEDFEYVYTRVKEARITTP
jgi:acetoacetyl-CoA synthetase|tara:strand:- start:35 stop:331 length:297 start_codon:yes stop_codon:yes gene_type:complete